MWITRLVRLCSSKWRQFWFKSRSSSWLVSKAPSFSRLCRSITVTRVVHGSLLVMKRRRCTFIRRICGTSWGLSRTVFICGILMPPYDELMLLSLVPAINTDVCRVGVNTCYCNDDTACRGVPIPFRSWVRRYDLTVDLSGDSNFRSAVTVGDNGWWKTHDRITKVDKLNSGLPNRGGGQARLRDKRLNVSVEQWLIVVCSRGTNTRGHKFCEVRFLDRREGFAVFT